MKFRRRTNLLWGLVVLAVALVVLLRALDVLPNGIYDLIVRAWPVLLVLAGLTIFLRERVPFGSLIALVVSAVLAAGVATTAFSTRVTQERDAYQQAINQPVGAGITLLRIHVKTLATRVELVRALDEGVVVGQFVGSTESKVQVDYTEAADSTATLSVVEEQPNPYPLLEAVGRGWLRLELPVGVPLDVEFYGADGAVSLNMSGLALERLNMDLKKGDALVTLPEYDPLGSPEDATLGVLAVRDGNITIFVPPTVAARFQLLSGSGSRPQFDPTVYNLLAVDNGVLEARNFDVINMKMRYAVDAPRGQVTLTVPGQ